MVNGLPDATRVVFDDERVVANAGVLLPAMLADRLGIEALVDRTVDLGDRAGAANPGRKVMSLVSAMALGADCIDDCDVLALGPDKGGVGPWSVGSVDAGDVSAGVHVRACPPARPSTGRQPPAGVGGRRRTGRRSPRRRCRSLRR